MATRSPLTEAVPVARAVSEARRPGDVPLWAQPEWAERFPWLIQGTTGRGDPDDFDLGVYGAVPTGRLMERWRRLREATGMPTVIHSRQVHAAEIAEWLDPVPPGVLHVDGYDAHLTDRAGILLTVSVADCVPVSIVSEAPRSVALVHAGWRGVAAGIVEGAIARLRRRGVLPETLWLHCGPAICGECYEVGPEVHSAVNPTLDAPAAPQPIDLREAIALRAASVGVNADRITRSVHCTRCGPGAFFSHRGGSPARQMGVLGCRP